MEDNQMLPFNERNIRKTLENGEWYFSIVDVIKVLTESPKPTAYWNKVQKALLKENQFYPFWIKLKFKGVDGKGYKTDCANTEGVLRIIMSIPSPKAEPFKLWLANVGKQFLVETENPELGYERLKEIYKAKGYSDEWIERRLKSISIRKELTDEWQKRGVKEGQEYAILTAEIAKATFGVTPSEHAKHKGLAKENLRDHMTNFELIFTMLGEDATRQVAGLDDAQGFNENHDAAQTGGKAAGRALKAFEEDNKIKVVSPSNFLSLLNDKDTEEEKE
jgi:DNA-damage-inducible protein D